MKSRKIIEEYCEHIGSAKKAETRTNRLSKRVTLLEI